jgi:LacI family transcriptional regulator
MRQVLINLGFNYSFTRDIWRGVVRYTYEHGKWSLWPSPPNQDEDWLKRFDGTIGMLQNPQEGEELLRYQKAVVNVSNRVSGHLLPSVLNDDVAIGRMAGEYYLSKGFRRFFYFGFPTHRYSLQRLEGFQLTLHRSGYAVEDISSVGDNALAALLKTMPVGSAIFCADDNLAFKVIRTCWENEIAVPQQVTILGVNNDETYCQSGTIGLSSVMPASERVGFQAAELLDRLMNGGTPPDHPILVQPLGVVTRLSTDMQSVQDEVVRKALQYIQQNVRDNFQVVDLLDHVRVGRRTLERKFKEHLGHSPHFAITRARVEMAKRLLEATQMKMDTIAQQCGFSEARILYRNFRLITGESPAKYRKNFQ